MSESFVQSPLVFGVCLVALVLLIATLATSRQGPSRRRERILLASTIVMTIIAVGLIALRFLVLKEG